MGNHGDGGEFYPMAKNLLICTTMKVPLNIFDLHLLISEVLFLLHQQFSSNHPMQSSFAAAVFFLASVFLNSGLMYTHAMLILINRCLLNLVFSMQKHWMGKVYARKVFIISTFQCYLEDSTFLTASLNSSFSHYLFIFQLTPKRNFMTCELIKYNDSKLVGINHMELFI